MAPPKRTFSRALHAQRGRDTRSGRPMTTASCGRRGVVAEAAVPRGSNEKLISKYLHHRRADAPPELVDQRASCPQCAGLNWWTSAPRPVSSRCPLSLSRRVPVVYTRYAGPPIQPALSPLDVQDATLTCRTSTRRRAACCQRRSTACAQWMAGWGLRQVASGGEGPGSSRGSLVQFARAPRAAFASSCRGHRIACGLVGGLAALRRRRRRRRRVWAGREGDDWGSYPDLALED